LQSNVEQSDRVGRRGLSEPREDFSRRLTHAFPWLYPGHNRWLGICVHGFVDLAESGVTICSD
jgi:hypothetical protein